MIDGRYTESEWQEIVVEIDAASRSNESLVAQVRQLLEKALAQYDHRQHLAEEMKNAADERDLWSDIGSQAQTLARLLKSTKCWTSPVWWAGSQHDDDVEKRATLEVLSKLALQARMNAEDYGDRAKRFIGQRNPDREELYRAILHVWVDHLCRGWGYTPSGPIVRFFQAAVRPVLGSDVPKSSSIRDIGMKEKDRREGLPLSVKQEMSRSVKLAQVALVPRRIRAR